MLRSNSGTGAKNRWRRSLMFAAGTLLAVLHFGQHAVAASSVCKNLPGRRAELVRTPRSDANLELLALALSEGVAANQEIYERLVRDVAAIRAQEARLKTIEYLPPHDGKTLLLQFSDTAGALVTAGKYQLWDCVNRHYGIESTQVMSANRVQLHLKGIYDLEKVASIYARLPGVMSAEPGRPTRIDDGATILVKREADAWNYIFRTRRSNAFYYFVTRSNQGPKYVGVSSARSSTTPAWLQRYWFGAERN